MLIALSRELLGPREGAREQIDVDPRGEYLIGVIEPKDYFRGALAFYGRSDFQTIEAGTGEDDDTGGEIDPIEISLQLDPRALPKSVGISFVVDGKCSHLIGLCATWAKYSRNEQKKWQRRPYRFITRNVDVSKDDELFREEGVRITLRSTVTSEGDYYVSLYLVNETPLSNEKYPRTEEHVFQPQLRVVCEKGGSIVPIIGGQEDEIEEASLSLLYRKRAAMARGHLCGVTWREVDPERPLNSTEDHQERPNAHPFIWVDSEIVEEPDRNVFTNPDVRTEYLPSYPVQQVIMKPKLEGANLKDLKAAALAEAWDPDVLGSLLEPIAGAFGEWIKRQKGLVTSLPQHYWSAAERNILLCESSNQRIREGIDLLKTDPDSRLAFCFMNKVMNQQSIWKTKEPLLWRLFQIAFILQCISGLVKEDHDDRLTCDLLWFPTAAGKTEAYLGLSIFGLALRRRRNRNIANGGAGTGVLSRYTLRMLTIQQFRRALYAITACDYLRVKNWRPKDYSQAEEHPWGATRFSIGLWVGQDVTPNRLIDHKGWDAFTRREVRYPGAVSLLRGLHIYAGTRFRVKRLTENEPAQILSCPVCGSILSTPKEPSLPPREYTMHFIVSSRTAPVPDVAKMAGLGFEVRNCRVTSMPSARYYTVSIRFLTNHKIGSDIIDRWWQNYVSPALGPDCRGEFARASRPGYFVRRWDIQREAVDFEIHCPNPQCELNKSQWFEFVPAPSEKSQLGSILDPFKIPGKKGYGYGVPISAYVVDDQIYHRCPSLVIATVDKFARLSYEPKAGALFGNVSKFDTCWGYYRDEAPPDRGDMHEGETFSVSRLDPPDLVVQDELHLIEGPLGSMVGIYETAIDILASKLNGNSVIRPKYVASTATVRHASSQVRAVFDRKLTVFPPLGLSIEDNFFSYTQEEHPLNSHPAGRLYVGVCAPGHGPHTPTIRIWTALLREAFELRLLRGSNDREADQFWTIVGYFNAIRELAAALGLFRGDIRERLRQTSTRLRPIESHLELSSRMESSQIPIALEQLAKFPDNGIDAVFSTSMFGTGVDVDRLGLMVVHGQPKTTANYIQATGRVGRLMGGLVITFLRATRPRDLDHYEFFAGYHRALSRYVEPITVHPFSPRARERALGPMAVALLRNANMISAIPVSSEWAHENLFARAGGRAGVSGCRRMKTERGSNEVQSLIKTIEERSQSQPDGCKPQPSVCRNEIASELDRWEAAAKSELSLIYYEPTFIREPENPVVLGDVQHEVRGLTIVYRNAPQSLREVESTTTFEG